MNCRFAFLLLLIALTTAVVAKEPVGPPPPPPTQADIAYKAQAPSGSYEAERCVLDLYLPAQTSRSSLATLVWFHGGGITAGSKDEVNTRRVAASLAQGGVAVVVPNYRLSPKVKYPGYVEDAAAAVAWAFQNMPKHGGDAKRIYVGGHSAGGYLALLLGMDARHLTACGIKPSSLAGVVPVSGQVMTHFTVRAERGVGRYTIVADDAAPARWAEAKGLPPMLVIWAEKDMPTRGEENAFFVSLLKAAKQKVTSLLVPGRDHGSVGHKIAEPKDPARKAILEFMQAQP